MRWHMAAVCLAVAGLALAVIAAPAAAHDPPDFNRSSFNDCAKLKDKDLQKSGMSWVVIKGCKLKEYRFDLAGANLYGTIIGDRLGITSNWAGVNLNGAILTYAHFNDGIDMSGATMVGAKLEHIGLSSANLAGANLSESRMEWADMGKANLAGANLAGAHLSSAYLYQANLSGANLAGITTAVPDEDLDNVAFFVLADMERAQLQNAVLPYAKLYGANLRGANMSGAHLQNAEMWRAPLHSADLSGANLTQAKFFINATLTKFGDETVCPHDYCTVHEVKKWYNRCCCICG